jgi:uncharacterized repeat protein (TIGR02543 family)
MIGERESMNHYIRFMIGICLVMIVVIFTVGCQKTPPQEFTIQLYPEGGTLDQTSIIAIDNSLITLPTPTKHGCFFVGWFIDNDAEQRFTEEMTIATNLSLYAKWENIPSSFDMVFVGLQTETYIVPINTQDTLTTEVQGGFKLAVLETTYELWYDVLQWALLHDYHFQNLGREGSVGVIGASPTEAKLEPVVSINWRDAIVWLNALSEKNGLIPVYRTNTNEVIRDSRNEHATTIDNAIPIAANGYRLPTVAEWQMAARWVDQSNPPIGAVNIENRHWLPGNYASGSSASVIDAEATNAVSWFRDESTRRIF